jgi:hypothetical protein
MLYMRIEFSDNIVIVSKNKELCNFILIDSEVWLIYGQKTLTARAL